jgi:hypothetical protein
VATLKAGLNTLYRVKRNLSFPSLKIPKSRKKEIYLYEKGRLGCSSNFGGQDARPMMGK